MSAMAEVGDVVRRRSKWVVVAPTHCDRGHELRPGRSLVGHVACTGHGGGHLIWHCRGCPDGEPPVYGPALGEHCSVLIGAAKVRIGTGPVVEETMPELPEPPTLD